MTSQVAIAEEKCDKCGVFQGFTISQIRKTFEYVSELSNAVYFEGLWTCEGCKEINCAQSEVSF